MDASSFYEENDNGGDGEREGEEHGGKRKSVDEMLVEEKGATSAAQRKSCWLLCNDAPFS